MRDKNPFLLVSILCIAAGVATGQTTATVAPNPELLLGMSTVLSGPAANLGIEMREGMMAAFDEVARRGGIRGRTIRLIALDDGYEPDRTAPNMRRLILEDGVLGIVGNVGTPTAIAALPISNAAEVPFYGAFTGAGVLRKSPPERFVVNFRASYAEETSAMVDALVDIAGIDPHRIAFFTQRDGYGDAGFAGGLSALRRHGVKDESEVSHGRYERNTLAIEDGLAEILQRELPRAVIMVGAYGPCAEFIKQAVQCDLDAIFLNVSFVGSASLASALGNTPAQVIVTQVVPHFDSSAPIVREYREALGKRPDARAPDFGSLEGYVAARILIRALDRWEGELTRNSVIDALEGLGNFDIGLGVPLELSTDSHQASHSVWPTIIRDGAVVPFEWTALAPSAAESPAK